MPTATETKVGPPNAEEARIIAGGVAGAVAIDGKFTSLQRMLMEATLESMTGFVVPVEHLPRLTAEQFARAVAPRDALWRQRMLQFMLVCALVLSPLPEEVVDSIEAYSRELGVSNDMLRVDQDY